MSILIVGSVLKDVYLNLDRRTEKFERDKNGVEWLDFSFDASEHHFFSQSTNLAGAVVSLEVLKNLGEQATVTNANVKNAQRYILIDEEKVAYLVPSSAPKTEFSAPKTAMDYLFIDRSANLSSETVAKIAEYLDGAPETKLVLYLKNPLETEMRKLAERAALVFVEGDAENLDIAAEKVVCISERRLAYLNIAVELKPERIDMLTHLSAYSILAATILGCFLKGFSVEDSLNFAKLNLENSKLNASLTLEKLQELAKNQEPAENLELIAANLVLKPKGILAADESGGSIKKKFAQLDIPDTYENRRDYRNLFFTTEGLENYVNGVILFDETARQLADNGQNFVEFLTAKQIIPGIKVDRGLEKFAGSEETYTKGLEGLPERLREYHEMGLRFAKWRAAFEIRRKSGIDGGAMSVAENSSTTTSSEAAGFLTPSPRAIAENCRILAEYAYDCQRAGIVPIVEPEVVFDGDYSIEDSTRATSEILKQLFSELKTRGVKLPACILKVNMVIAGKRFAAQSTAAEVGAKTAEVLKKCVPEELAGVVFLSGGQTPEQATENLAAVLKNGPFPWPVTFSFARALQDPALFAWRGDNNNADAARAAFKARLEENRKALEG